MSAYLRGQSIDDAELLTVVGPGLAAGPDVPPIPARDWNAFAFVLGARLLASYSRQASSQAHVVDICSTALATVSAAHDLLTQPDITVTLASIEATLVPMTLFSGSPAAELQLRIFRWGMRRIRRDRYHHDSLADLARAAADAHAEIAARAGDAADDAREVELTAQRADAKAVLAGSAASLIASITTRG